MIRHSDMRQQEPRIDKLLFDETSPASQRGSKLDTFARHDVNELYATANHFRGSNCTHSSSCMHQARPVGVGWRGGGVLWLGGWVVGWLVGLGWFAGGLGWVSGWFRVYLGLV